MQDFIKTFLLVVFFVFLTTFAMLRLVHHGREKSSVKSKVQTNSKNKNGCGRYPEDLMIDNTVWQVLHISKGLVNILNAYIDERPRLGTKSTVVRINVNSVELNDSDVFHCQFWYEDRTEAIVVKATEILLMWGKIEILIFFF